MYLHQLGEFTDDLFSIVQSATSEKVMSVLDEISGRWGRRTLRAASVPAEPEWAMRRELLSGSFTTRLDQLLTIKAN